MACFYATTDAQIKSLYGILGVILFWNILTVNTNDHSILYEIAAWPLRDFFKVFLFVHYKTKNCKLKKILTNFILKQRKNFFIF